jgi:hypothetical protein
LEAGSVLALGGWGLSIEASGNLEAGSVLALGGGGLSIEASGNLEKRKCPWADECEPPVEHAGSHVRRF